MNPKRKFIETMMATPLQTSRSRGVLILAFCLFGVSPVSAQNMLYWDTNGGTAGTGGTGTWNLNGTTFWSASSSGGSTGAWVNGLNDVANFGGTAGTVTVSNANGNVVAREIRVTVSGYTLSGGKITIDTQGSTVGVNTNINGAGTAVYNTDFEFARGGVASSNEYFNIENMAQFSTATATFNGNFSATDSRGVPSYTGIKIHQRNDGATMVFNGQFLATSSPSTYMQLRVGDATLAGENATYIFNADNSGMDAVTNAVHSGKVLLGHANAFGASSTVVSLGANGSTKAASFLTNGAITVANSTILLNGNASSTGVLTLGGNSAHASTFNGNVTNSGYMSVRLSAVSGGTVTFNGTIANAGSNAAATVTKTGLGTVVLAGNSSYTQATIINQGVLSVGSLANGGVSSNIGASAATADKLVLGGGTLLYTGTNRTTNRAFTLTNATSSGINVQESSTTLTFSGGTAATTGALTKSGDGTLVLSGASQYTGTTTVAAGTLLISGSLASSSVAVQGGSSLRVDGTVSGTVNVQSGATLSGVGTVSGATTVAGNLNPGNSPGVLSFENNLTLQGNTNFEINGLSARGVDYDGVDVDGVFTLGGSLAFAFGGSALSDGSLATLFSFAGTSLGDFSSVTSTGFYAGTWTSAGDGSQWLFNQDNQSLIFNELDGSLSVAAVPEPSTWALLGLGLASLIILRRNSRKIKS